jgi:hypothetical protein
MITPIDWEFSEFDKWVITLRMLTDYFLTKLPQLQDLSTEILRALFDKGIKLHKQSNIQSFENVVHVLYTTYCIRHEEREAFVALLTKHCNDQKFSPSDFLGYIHILLQVLIHYSILPLLYNVDKGFTRNRFIKYCHSGVLEDKHYEILERLYGHCEDSREREELLSQVIKSNLTWHRKSKKRGLLVALVKIMLRAPHSEEIIIQDLKKCVREQVH